MAKPAKYKEGDWFAVPLVQSGWAVGRIARMKRSIRFGYFFGPPRQFAPTREHVSELRPSDAVYLTKFGYLGLKTGTWPVLGGHRNRSRADWPMPAFCHHMPGDPLFWRDEYDENDPARHLSRTRVDEAECARLPEAGLAGHVFVERRLSKLLGWDGREAKGGEVVLGYLGTGLFGSDTAADVRVEYEEALKSGLNAEAATKQVLYSWREMLNDMDDGPIVWMTLAALQLEQGEVLPDVRQHALVAIDSGTDQKRWREDAEREFAAERERVLANLRDRLTEKDG